MNAVIYCRVSSKEQVEGTSLESQQLACEEYARGKSIKVLRTFIEEGESAKFADRTELLSLIDFCRDNKGQVNTLLVWKVDRFARNVADHFSVKAVLQKYGVQIVSVTEPIDTNPEGRLMETILAGFAQFDNDVRAARTVQGMRRKIQEGIFPWRPPLGYKIRKSGRDKKNRPDEPEQPAFGLLQRAWQQFATGVYTKAEMKRLMQTWGIVSRNNRPLPDQSIDKLFRNPYYAGILVDPWSGEEYQGQHVPMISREEFARVQQIISRRNRAVPHHRQREEFPLRGLVRCERCHRYMTASFARGRSNRYPYYHCFNRSCDRRGKGIAAAEVHNEFRRHLANIAPKPALLGSIGEMVARTADERAKAIQSKQARSRNHVHSLSQELSELVRMRTQRLVSDEEFRTYREALLSQKQAIEATSASSRFKITEVRQNLGAITEPLRALLDTWNLMWPAVRSRFQRLIFPVGFVVGKVGTADLGLLFTLFGQLAHGDAPLVTQETFDWNRLGEEIQQFSEVLKEYHDSQAASKSGVPTELTK